MYCVYYKPSKIESQECVKKNYKKVKICIFRKRVRYLQKQVRTSSLSKIRGIKEGGTFCTQTVRLRLFEYKYIIIQFSVLIVKKLLITFKVFIYILLKYKIFINKYRNVKNRCGELNKGIQESNGVK